jgi:hypothetical protein
MITVTEKSMKLIVVYYDFTSYVTPFLVKFFYSLFIMCYITTVPLKTQETTKIRVFLT